MRRRQGRGLSSSASFDDGEQVNPMDGVANLVDIMLVFSVGLMVSIVMNWNINILEVEALANNQDEEIEADSEFEEVEAQVFRDPSTGKLYIVEPEITKDDSQE
jgi:hypothetical protein